MEWFHEFEIIQEDAKTTNKKICEGSVQAERLLAFNTKISPSIQAPSDKEAHTKLKPYFLQAEMVITTSRKHKIFDYAAALEKINAAKTVNVATLDAHIMYAAAQTFRNFFDPMRGILIIINIQFQDTFQIIENARLQSLPISKLLADLNNVRKCPQYSSYETYIDDYFAHLRTYINIMNACLKIGNNDIQ